MGAPATFAQTYGLQTIGVRCSLRLNGTAADQIRDGKSGIVKSVARTAAGVFTFTLDRKLTRMIAGIAQVNAVDATPTDVTCQCAYNESTGVVTVYCLTGAVLTDPENLSRVSFVGEFSHRSDLKDAA